MRGRMRSFDQGSTRAPARERCRRQRPEGRSAQR
ncbi:protamine-like protein [Escherichia coli NCTC 50110]|nr:protamine-like protein [Escherichia coli]KGL71678.1 protamine-like protein [Escherichia coli NCTC 50110]BAA36099.1 predicted protamine-like protein [Escherichia coli str. K-12 substr. W3110]BAL38297.1 predicted protamine-like protein [Escherichia coli str. K-12 substr. MDS42]WIM30789.1 putative protamine-like protein [Escherichia coli]